MISEHLNSCQDKRNILLLNKRCYRALLPGLYRDVRICGGLVNFIRSLKEDAKLRPLVRRFAYTGEIPHSWNEWLGKTYGITPYEMESNNETSTLPKLMAYLPNVRTLDLILDHSAVPVCTAIQYQYAPLSPDTFWFDDCGPFSLGRLVKLIIEGHLEYFDVQPLLHLPKLRILQVIGYQETVRDEGSPEPGRRLRLELEHGVRPPSPTSKVRNLSFLGSSYTGQSLFRLAMHCKILEVFEYERHDGLSDDESIPGLCYEALTPHKSSLRTLRLSEVPSMNHEFDVSQIETTRLIVSEAEEHFGSLEDFIRLRKIKLPMAYLIDFIRPKVRTMRLSDMFPSTLEHLSIHSVLREDRDILKTNIQQMLDVRHDKFPGWSKLSLTIPGRFLQSDASGLPQDRETAPFISDLFEPMKVEWEKQGMVVKFEPWDYLLIEEEFF